MTENSIQNRFYQKVITSKYFTNQPVCLVHFVNNKDKTRAQGLILKNIIAEHKKNFCFFLIRKSFIRK